MRYRLIQSLTPLAAASETLVAYVHDQNMDIDEAIRDFIDWTSDCIPWLSDEGLLPGTLRTALEELFHLCIAAMEVAPHEPCEVVVQHEEFDRLRATADKTLKSFAELGIAMPSLQPGLFGSLETVPEAER